MIQYQVDNAGAGACLCMYRQKMVIPADYINTINFIEITGSVILPFYLMGAAIFPNQLIIKNDLDNIFSGAQLVDGFLNPLTEKIDTPQSFYTFSPIQTLPKGHAHSDYPFKFYLYWNFPSAYAGSITLWLIFSVAD